MSSEITKESIGGVTQIGRDRLSTEWTDVTVSSQRWAEA
jgi:hypothetical protein